MSRFISTLEQSFRIFASNPKLVVPKLFIVLLYSIPILLTPKLFFEGISEPAVSVLLSLLALLGISLAAAVADIFVSAMYPFMVAQFRSGGKIGLAGAFNMALSKAGVAVPSVIIIFSGLFALLFLISVPLAFLIVSAPAYSLAFTVLYVLVLLGVVFLFYNLYPVIVLENNSVLGSLRRSVKLSLSNRGEVAKVTLLSFTLSLASFALAFLPEVFPDSGETLLFWGAFIIVRILTAYVYSYLFVLNPVFYYNYVKN